LVVDTQVDGKHTGVVRGVKERLQSWWMDGWVEQNNMIIWQQAKTKSLLCMAAGYVCRVL
jgi:hypothetical protein